MEHPPTVQYTGLSNGNSNENSKRSTKILLFVFVAVAFVTISLVLVYIISKNTKIGTGILNIKSDANRKSNAVSVTGPGGPYSQGSYILYTNYLPVGKVGNEYKGVITVLFFGIHTEVTAKILNNLPEGLQLSPCEIKYDNPDIKETAPISTIGSCDITGIPTKEGKYTLNVEIDRPSIDPIHGDFPLVINQ
jgi:hypothetical protein